MFALEYEDGRGLLGRGGSISDRVPDARETGETEMRDVFGMTRRSLGSSIQQHAPPRSTHEDPLAPARGVLIAVVLGLILWAVIIFVLVR
jgi:hypothetical protein